MRKRHFIPSLLALCLVASPAMAADLSQSSQVRVMAAGCANCHGTQGMAQGTIASLAGQDKQDLVQKMADFKAGKRPATVMHQLAKGYSDEQIEQLAAYFAVIKK